jgi:hypothetical protein
MMNLSHIGQKSNLDLKKVGINPFPVSRNVMCPLTKMAENTVKVLIFIQIRHIFYMFTSLSAMNPVRTGSCRATVNSGIDPL